jgi:hypothetical protein
VNGTDGIVTIRAIACACLLAIPMAGCGDGSATVVEAAQAACIKELEAIYGFSQGKTTATFARVPNSSKSKSDFEFTWATKQISGLASGVTAAELKAMGGELPPPGVHVHIEMPIRDYICRGSLEARTIEGIWRGAVAPHSNWPETKITTRPVRF